MAFVDIVHARGWRITSVANTSQFSTADTGGFQKASKGAKDWTGELDFELSTFGPQQINGSGSASIVAGSGFNVGGHYTVRFYENGTLYHSGQCLVERCTISGNLAEGRVQGTFTLGGYGALTFLTPSAGTPVMSSRDGDVEWEVVS